MPFKKHILITGGAGFIGSHLVRHFVNKYPDYHIYNLDALTYAGNLENLKSVEKAGNYTFIKGDIRDEIFIDQLFKEKRFEAVIHLAAESHVDRSIHSPLDFAKTNILGTMTLLNAFKDLWEGDFKDKLFYHISTDEVYGALGNEGLFTEKTSYAPNSPYSASKAASDHFVRAYGETYDLPFVISNCSNNYGPYQFPEKLIPLTINNILEGKPLPIYGKGENIRDWLYVEDHTEAIDLIFHKGKRGETYNIGGLNEKTNIELVKLICGLMDDKLGQPKGTSAKLIRFVSDRPGHDFRYAIDASKIQKELGWKSKTGFENGLEKTVDWYLEHRDWVEQITSGNYREYYRRQYEQK